MKPSCICEDYKTDSGAALSSTIPVVLVAHISLKYMRQEAAQMILTVIFQRMCIA